MKGASTRIRGLAAACALAGCLALLGAAPAPAAPAATVTPFANLPDTATVNVSGTGWTPDNGITIRQCNSDGSACVGFGVAVADLGGAFGPVPFQVSKVFVPDAPPGPAIDCAVAACTVHVEDFLTPAINVNHPISFGSPPAVPTTTTTTTAAPPVKRCKKGRKLRRGKCVKKKRKR